MLRKRLIASLFMITPVLIIFWLDTNWNFNQPGLWSVPLVVLTSLVVAGELLAMTKTKTAGAIAWVTYLGTFLCQLAVASPELFSMTLGMSFSNRWLASCIAIAVTIVLAFANELFRFHEERQSTQKIALTILIVLYSGWLLSFLSATRLEQGNFKGAMALFSIIFIIKMSDAGAYFAGKNLGKHKLAPMLSPGKTIEGLVGGVIAALVAAGIVFAWFVPNLPTATDGAPVLWMPVLGYAISICLIGVVGDLSESLIKRDMGCKDSSGWLPGLGGIMDTTDSVMLAAPVAYLWWSSGWL